MWQTMVVHSSPLPTFMSGAMTFLIANDQHWNKHVLCMWIKCTNIVLQNTEPAAWRGLKALSKHFIRNTVLVLGRASFCTQNSLEFSWHWFHLMFEKFPLNSSPFWHDWKTQFLKGLQVDFHPVNSLFLHIPKVFYSIQIRRLGRPQVLLSCSWNWMFETTLTLWHGALSCWMKPLEDG